MKNNYCPRINHTECKLYNSNCCWLLEENHWISVLKSYFCLLECILWLFLSHGVHWNCLGATMLTITALDFSFLNHLNVGHHFPLEQYIGCLCYFRWWGVSDMIPYKTYLSSGRVLWMAIWSSSADYWRFWNNSAQEIFLLRVTDFLVAR